MFQMFPKTRLDWLRALPFAVQSYVVVAFVEYKFFAFIWPHGKFALSCLQDFQEIVVFGYLFCFVGLSCGGIAALFSRRWRDACLNLGLAVLNAFLVESASFAIS